MDVANELYDNLPDDIKELIALGIYTKEEAIEKLFGRTEGRATMNDDFDYNAAMESLYSDTEYIINKSAYDSGVEGVKEEIVRCRDCADCTEEGIYTPQYYCRSIQWNHQSWQGTPTDPDGFCKWGKRKEK